MTPKFVYKLSNYIIIISKVTPKSESKLYNYNKILKYININYKLLFLSLLAYYYYLYKNTTHDICYYIFMYDGRDKNTNSQTNSSTVWQFLATWEKPASSA